MRCPKMYLFTYFVYKPCIYEQNSEETSSQLISKKENIIFNGLRFRCINFYQVYTL